MKLKTSFKILIVCSIVVPALIIGAVGSTLYNSFLTSMTAEEAASVAYSAATSEALFFDSFSSKLSALAVLEPIKRAAGGDYAAIQDEVDQILDSMITSDSSLLDLIIMDSSGIVVVADSDGLVQKNFEGYNDELAATETDSVYFSSLYINNEKYFDDIFYIVKPLESSIGSKGYVAAVISASQINVRLTSSGFFGGKGTLILIDSAGNAINYDGSIKRSDEFSLKVDVDYEKIIESEDTRYTSFDENGYYGAYGRLSGSSWVWIGLYPASAASFSVMPAILIGLVILAVFIVIDSLLAFNLYRRAITPIGVIINSMKEIETGDRQKRLPRFKTYEFQAISDVFNKLLNDFYISEDIHKTIAELSKSMLFEWDLENESMYVSDNFKDMFGLDYENAGLADGSFIDSLMNEEDARRFQNDMKSLTSNTREYVENEYQVKTLRNTEIWINVKTSSVITRSGDVTRILGVVTDINNKKKSSMQLSQKASYDFLSQLYNRSTFLKELQKRLDLKRSNESFAIMFIDVDDFKFVNDRYSHSVGDEVIKFVSDVIRECLGENGIAGRFGGDEFVMCITDPEKVKACDEFAMSVIDRLYQGYDCEEAGTKLAIRASIGISLAPEHGTNAEKLVGAADEAMYFVKKNGKSNYHIYNPSDAPSLDLGNTII